jgi:hypothetical protein
MHRIKTEVRLVIRPIYTGTIIEIAKSYADAYPYLVEFRGDIGKSWYQESELEVLPEIKLGATVRPLDPNLSKLIGTVLVINNLATFSHTVKFKNERGLVYTQTFKRIDLELIANEGERRIQTPPRRRKVTI